MRHESLPIPAAEPCFELPPRLALGVERRLTMRAAAISAQHHEFRDNAVTLDFGATGIVVRAVGGAVAAAFGLVPGRLDDDHGDDLAARLGAACAALRTTGAVVAFEAAVPARHAVCVLLRGVLLPTRRGAEAILSWKEVLGADATERLRAELLQVFDTPRSVPVDAFARR